jgi:CDP-glucose 4,6-dehydratase
MTFLLEHLKVPVVGYSLPAEKDSLYDRAERTGAIHEALADIRDYDSLEKFIDLHKPSTIIHMAAQPLVLKSYESPRETFDVNVMGTVNVLDIAFKKDFVKAIIVVTTDKVYRNDNSGRAFVETDPLEGKDPYSASKVGTEAVVAAWQQIAKISGGPRVVSVRAGNVIGGGDFAENRIIPDLIRGMLTGETVVIRNPYSTRPWQHALDPLFGYLQTIEELISGKEFSNLNFGPQEEDLTVKSLVQIAQEFLSSKDIELKIQEMPVSGSEAESTLLNIDSRKATQMLNWIPVWGPQESIIRTFEWWQKYSIEPSAIEKIISSDVSDYLSHIPSSKLK